MTNWCWRCWRCCPCWPSEYDRPTGLHRCLIRIASTMPSQEWFHHVEVPFAAHRLHEKTICRMLKIILSFYKMLILQTVQMVCSPFGKFSCHSLCPISLIHCTLEAPQTHPRGDCSRVACLVGGLTKSIFAEVVPANLRKSGITAGSYWGLIQTFARAS